MDYKLQHAQSTYGIVLWNGMVENNKQFVQLKVLLHLLFFFFLQHFMNGVLILFDVVKGLFYDISSTDRFLILTQKIV